MKNIVISFTRGTGPDVSCHIPAIYTHKRSLTVLPITLQAENKPRCAFRMFFVPLFFLNKGVEATTCVYARDGKE